MRFTITLLFCFSVLQISAQSKKHSNSVFKDYYPISIKPVLGYISSMNDYEEILFDAKTFSANQIEKLELYPKFTCEKIEVAEEPA